MNEDDHSEISVAAAALAFSLVALVATLLQVAQQYYSSAAGYSNCDYKVMGPWSQSKTRTLRWTEFRFEVQFDAPVIFVCEPHNDRGPIANAEIILLTGDDRSVDSSMTTLQDKKEEDEDKTDKERIQTADNERATWVTLLSAFQRQERESRDWQQQQYTNLGPPDPSSPIPSPPTLMEHHTLTVAVQKKRRSWDTMPSNVKKPYATTTMCHLVEMLAILGVHWVEFDRTHDRYRAEGNGFAVSGEKVSDLGLMFSFQVTGKSHFAETRIIPVDEVKELCFGRVPTVYRETMDARKLQSTTTDFRGVSALELGSSTEIAETLVLIGCNINTVNYFAKGRGRHSHLFPVAFEILGMLGATLHIEGSCFRMLPNPTLYRWDRNSFSLRDMLHSFSECFQKSIQARRNHSIVDRINEHIAKIKKHIGELPVKTLSRPDINIPLLNALHRALDDADEILTAKKKTARPPRRSKPHVSETLEKGMLNHRRTRTNSDGKLMEPPVVHKETDRERLRREIVQDVLRSHIQEVLHLLNERPEEETTSPQTAQSYGPRYEDLDTQGPRQSRQAEDADTKVPFPVLIPNRIPRFEDIDSAAPEDKQARFMDVYFKVIRVKVVGQAAGSTVRRGSAVPATALPPALGVKRAPTEKSIQEMDAESVDPADPGVGSDTSATATDAASHPLVLAELDAVYHDDIWCVLLFRMICWLMLHDFHKKDVQKPKSELLGSRLPVYIA